MNLVNKKKTRKKGVKLLIYEESYGLLNEGQKYITSFEYKIFSIRKYTQAKKN